MSFGHISSLFFLFVFKSFLLGIYVCVCQNRVLIYP